MKSDWKSKAGPTERNKIGVDDDTMKLVKELKQETGIPHARIVRDGVLAIAPKLRQLSTSVTQQQSQPRRRQRVA